MVGVLPVGGGGPAGRGSERRPGRLDIVYLHDPDDHWRQAPIDLWYWGDIDTHGFAILSRVRSHFPHTRSLLMDRHTLLAHRAHWGEEKHQTSEPPVHLTPAEAQLEQDLRLGTYQPHLRLEQERIPSAQ
jgi:hypothetical protein